MKIFLDNIIFSLQHAGGISCVWANLIKQLLPMTAAELRFIEHKNAISNIERYKLDLARRGHLYAMKNLNLSRFLSVRIDNYNSPFIFHSSYFRLCDNPNAVNITTVHDLIHEKGFYKGLRRDINMYMKRRAIINSDHIICVSRNTRDDLLHFYPDVNPKKVTVVHNGVSEIDYFPNYDCKISQLIPYAPRSFVLFIGKREKYKNFDIAVDGVAQCDMNLVVVGPELNKKEQKLIAKKQCRCMQIGYLPVEQLNMLYNTAYALAYPSSYEGFGLPVIEAQKAGCPVIAASCSSIPEIYGNFTPLLMKEPSTEEFVKKVHMLQDSDLRNKVIEQGLRNANRFSWRKTAIETMKVYRKALKNHSVK